MCSRNNSTTATKLSDTWSQKCIPTKKKINAHIKRFISILKIGDNVPFQWPRQDSDQSFRSICISASIFLLSLQPVGSPRGQ